MCGLNHLAILPTLVSFRSPNGIDRDHFWAFGTRMSPPVTSYVYKSPGKAKLRKKVVNIYIISVKVELLLFADTQDIDPVDYLLSF